MARECHGGCGRDPELDWDDPDARLCRMCWEEEQEWRAAESHDAAAKVQIHPTTTEDSSR